jgi:hypothetical protein
MTARLRRAGFNLVRRGAEALGSPDEGRLRGLHEPATAGFALVAEGFSPTESAASQRMCGKTMNLTARAAPQKSESHPLASGGTHLLWRYTAAGANTSSIASQIACHTAICAS